MGKTLTQKAILNYLNGRNENIEDEDLEEAKMDFGFPGTEGRVSNQELNNPNNSDNQQAKKRELERENNTGKPVGV